MKPVNLTPTGKNSNLGSTSMIPKSPLPSTSTSKSYLAPLYSTPKSSKSSAAFGIIWLPSRRNNKKKDQEWNSHSNDHYKERDRTPTMYNFMSGDSQPYKKKEEDDFLMPHRSKESATINIGTTVAMADASLDTTGLDKVIEKQDYMRHEIEDTKKYLNRPLIVKHIPQLTCKVFKKYICCLRSSMEYAAAPEGGGDTNENNLKSEKETFNPDEIINNSSRVITESEKESCDNVDSVYLRPPPPGKARSSASVKDEDCGINCLYYTLQCCECVIM